MAITLLTTCHHPKWQEVSSLYLGQMWEALVSQHLLQEKERSKGRKRLGMIMVAQGIEVSEIKIEIRRAALKMVREEVMWSSRGTEFHTEKPLEQRPWARASLIWAEEQEAFVRGDKWVKEEKSRKGWRQRGNEEPDLQRLWATMKPLALALGETGDVGNFRREAWHDDSGWAGGRWVWEVEAEGQWGSSTKTQGRDDGGLHPWLHWRWWEVVGVRTFFWK